MRDPIDPGAALRSGENEVADRDLFAVLLRVPEVVLHLLLKAA